MGKMMNWQYLRAVSFLLGLMAGLMTVDSEAESVIWVGSGSAAGGSGTSWSDSSNWTKIPTFLTDAEVTFTSDGMLNIDTTSVAKNLYIDGPGTVQFEAIGSLSTSSLYIGHEGVGILKQADGTNSVGHMLYLGKDSGSSGSYELSGGNLSATTINVGAEGSGQFKWTGGTLDADTININSTGNMTVGQDWIYGGTLNINGGDANLSEQRFMLDGAGSGATANLTSGNVTGYFQIIGYDSMGTFKQTGGTNSIGHLLYLGRYSGSNGTYELSGTSQLSSRHNQCIGFAGTGTFRQKGGVNSAGNDLYIGWNSGSSGTYELEGTSQLSTAENQHIGFSGTGTFKQTGGTNSVSNILYLGELSGSTGTYELSDTGQLSAYSLHVGSFGTGTFKQTGGTNLIEKSILISHATGSSGRYELSGDGYLSSEKSLYIGQASTGTFKQTGGTNSVGETLCLGYDYDAVGVYELSGTGQLSSGLMQNIGQYGTGTFKQSGGTNSVGSDLRLGVFSGSNGTYELSGMAQLSIIEYMHIGLNGTGLFKQMEGTNSVISTSKSIYIGIYGTGIFKQMGGTNSVGWEITLGNYSGSNGRYELSGTGQLSSGHLTIGSRSTGTFKQMGGTNSVDWGITLGYNSGSSGAYELSGGNLSAKTINVGRDGAGQFIINNPSSEILVSHKLRFGSNSILDCVDGTKIHITGSAFENENVDAAALAGLENLGMIFEGGTENISLFEVAGEDLEAVSSGYESNFALGSLQIGGDMGIGQVQLVNLFDNRPSWTGSEALYVKNLILGAGSRLDLNGLNLYYQTFTNLGGTIDLNGGNLTAVPEPSLCTLLVGLSLAVLLRRRAE